MRDASTILIQNIFHMLCYAFKVLRQRNYQDVGMEDFAHYLPIFLANRYPDKLKSDSLLYFRKHICLMNP